MKNPSTDDPKHERARVANSSDKQAPTPRRELKNSALTRPDWLKQAPRSSESIWLDKNENLDPSLLEIVRSVVSTIDPLALCTYPECRSLYEKLARWVGVPPTHLLLTPGSDGAIRLVFEAFTAAGDDVLHTTPTFAMYPVYSMMFGLKVESLVYERSDSGPVLRATDVVDRIEHSNPKLVCLPNPDSPTGHVLQRDELLLILAACERVGALLLIDEAYHPFYSESVVDWTLHSKNLVVARTFAKAWGMAGLRIGYAVAHPETLQYMSKMRPMYETSTFAVAVVEKMLDHVDAMQTSVQRLNEGKKYFIHEMEALGFPCLRTEGNFLHVNFGSQREVVTAALKDRVLFRPDFSDKCLNGFSRFSATTMVQFNEVVVLIRKAIGVEKGT